LTNSNYQIIRTKDPNVIEHLLPHIEKLVNKTHEDYSVESFVKWLRVSISNPLVKTWIVIKKRNKFVKGDTKIAGYAIGTITSNLEEEYFNISHLYSTEKQITKDLLNTIEHWAKKNGLSKIGGVTKRLPKAWEKLYGYKLISYNLIKEI